MEAAPTDATTGVPSDPWERAVRSITLAARADVLEHMADRWSAYVATIDHCRKQLSDVWEDLAKVWTGPAADECLRSGRGLSQSLHVLSDSYGPAQHVLSASASAVKDAIHAIPIPIFTGGNLPGGTGKGALDGPALYDDYQNGRGHYADYAFRDAALAEGQDVEGVRNGRNAGGYTEHNTATDPGLHTRRDAAAYRASVNAWYIGNQDTANTAQATLVREYGEHSKQIPSGSGYFQNPDSGGTGNGAAGVPPRTGGGVTSGAGGSPSLGALPVGDSGAHSSARVLPHTLPPHAVLGPPDTRVGRSADDDPPSGSSLAAAPGSDASAVPGVSAAGDRDAARGIGGFGGRASGVPVPSTSGPTNGWWSAPPLSPAGPAAPSPAALNAGNGTTGGAGMPSGVGMMPAGGGRTKATAQEDYTTWLKEDDEEIWGPRWEDQPTGLVE